MIRFYRKFGDSINRRLLTQQELFPEGEISVSPLVPTLEVEGQYSAPSLWVVSETVSTVNVSSVVLNAEFFNGREDVPRFYRVKRMWNKVVENNGFGGTLTTSLLIGIPGTASQPSLYEHREVINANDDKVYDILTTELVIPIQNLYALPSGNVPATNGGQQFPESVEIIVSFGFTGAAGREADVDTTIVGEYIM